jgi:hypothetical protein
MFISVNTLASERILSLHVPVEWFALVADSALNAFFALAQFTFRY